MKNRKRFFLNKLVSPQVAALFEDVSLKCTWAGVYPCARTWRIRRGVARSDCFFYIKSGRGTGICGDDEVEARAGDVFILKKGHSNGFTHDPDDPLTVYSVGFHLKTRSGNDIMQYFSLPYRVHPGEAYRRRLERLYRDTIDSYHTSAPAAKLALYETLFRLIAHILDCVRNAGSGQILFPEGDVKAGTSRIDAVMDYINRSPVDADMPIPTLARMAGVTPGHFSSVFRRRYRISPKKYILRKRMDHARKLLLQTDMPVLQIARCVGMTDEYYFSRAFKKVEGLSPSLFRRSYKSPSI